jgi:hypothetical protein
MAYLEEVFLFSGIPSHTFVEPLHYGNLRVSLRSPGRCAVIEGPSGIGKTTSVLRLIEELQSSSRALVLSARKPSDVELIQELPSMDKIGTVIIDDFHRLDDRTKACIADFMKILADEQNKDSKLVLIGINKAGNRLIDFGNDIGLRMDLFKMEGNPDNKIEELIKKGEDALGVQIHAKDEIVKRSHGSFQIAQLLCQKLCISADITETQNPTKIVSISVEPVVDTVMVELRRIFFEPCIAFARGSKLRREGRAPYLHILKWLAESDDWSLDLSREIQIRPEHKPSVGQVIEKGYLATLLTEKASIFEGLFYYQPETSVISVEDPRIVFFLKNIVWRAFTREVGYTTEYFKGLYDIALSFAGEDRDYAKLLNDALTEREVSVFYDHAEQHRILATNVEDYLAPIYRTEAAYVVPLLGPKYPKKIWTKFESDNFKSRFGENAVIPIRFRNVEEGYFSETSNRGGMSFDPSNDVNTQIKQIADTICARLAEDRALDA